MKTNMSRWFVTAVACTAALGCVGDPTAVLPELDPSFAKGGKGGGGGGKSEATYQVEVQHDLGDAIVAKVTSDGLGVYVDGVDQVTANVERQFNLDTDSNKGPKAGQRRLCLDFTDPMDPAMADPPFLMDCMTDAKPRTSDHDNDPDGLIGMSENSSIQSFSRVYFLSNDASMQYFLRWCDRTTQDDPEKCAEGGAANKVDVTRGTGNTWTIEATSGQIARLYGISTGARDTFHFLGDFRMPFRYVVTQQ